MYETTNKQLTETYIGFLLGTHLWFLKVSVLETTESCEPGECARKSSSRSNA